MKAIKRILAVALILLVVVPLFVGCAKEWTCDWCGKTWRGDAYYADYNDTLCAECADKYWNPLPYRNYKK